MRTLRSKMVTTVTRPCKNTRSRIFSSHRDRAECPRTAGHHARADVRSSTGGQCSVLKVHSGCHAIQWFYGDFLRSKMAARRLEAAAGQREARLCRTFFLHQFRASRSIDVGVSISYPCKVIPLSDEDGLWDKIKKVKTKRQVSPWKMGKIHGNQNRLVELHGSILSCLGPKIVQDDLESRGFQVQLCIFCYTVQCTLR